MRQDRGKNLKLIGANRDDLKVISAYLQDSVIAVNDIVYLKKNKTFIMIANRFCGRILKKEFLGKTKE